MIYETRATDGLWHIWDTTTNKRVPKMWFVTERAAEIVAKSMNDSFMEGAAHGEAMRSIQMELTTPRCDCGRMLTAMGTCTGHERTMA